VHAGGTQLFGLTMRRWIALLVGVSLMAAWWLWPAERAVSEGDGPIAREVTTRAVSMPVADVARPVRIEGVVLDPRGEVAPDAVVYFTTPKEVRSAKTDASGGFFFEGPAAKGELSARREKLVARFVTDSPEIFSAQLHAGTVQASTYGKVRGDVMSFRIAPKAPGDVADALRPGTYTVCAARGAEPKRDTPILCTPFDVPEGDGEITVQVRAP
jgi:hypothetical protein